MIVVLNLEKVEVVEAEDQEKVVLEMVGLVKVVLRTPEEAKVV